MIPLNVIIILSWLNSMYEEINTSKNTLVNIVYDNQYFYLLVYSIIGLNSYNRQMISIFGDTKIGNSMKTLWYYIFYYTTLYIYLHSQDWFYDGIITQGYPAHTFTVYAKLLYIISTAYYINEIYEHINREVKKKDDTEMLIHHIATIILICGSYQVNALRTGLYILYLHDINDILLHISKLFVYNKSHSIYSTVTFAMFGISWIYTRLYIFPFYIVYDIYKYKQCSIINTLSYILSILMVLNIIWFGYFLKALKNSLTGKLEDIRED